MNNGNDTPARIAYLRYTLSIKRFRRVSLHLSYSLIVDKHDSTKYYCGGLKQKIDSFS